MEYLLHGEWVEDLNLILAGEVDEVGLAPEHGVVIFGLVLPNLEAVVVLGHVLLELKERLHLTQFQTLLVQHCH